jgi:ferritin
MLSEKLEKALNDQFHAELYSAYLYLSMAAYFKSVGLEGFAHWMSVQAQEELMHAMKFYAFIHQRGGRVILGPVEAPPSQWSSAEAVFNDVLAHEQKVTGRIHQLVETAHDDRDHATGIFLQWFVTEQVEEEESAHAVLQKLRYLDGAPGGLFMVDQELGRRPSASMETEGAV